MEMTLYPWQEKCLKRWFSNRGRGIVQAATGTGKTFLALTAIKYLEEKTGQELHVKIVVPTGTLLRQWNQSLQNFLISSCHIESAEMQGMIGLRGGGFHTAANRKYMIYVINSARYELARQILSDLKDGNAVFLIADECHRYESEQNRLIFEFLPFVKPYEDKFFSLGLSATLPSGHAKNYLTSVLGPEIYRYKIAQASAQSTVCQYEIFHIGLSFSQEELDEYQEITDRMRVLSRVLQKACPVLLYMSQKERFRQLRALAGEKRERIAKSASIYMNLSYKRKGLVCLASARINCACALVKRLPKEEKILIFSERILQAERLYQLLRSQYPGKVGCCHSRMGQQANQNTLNRFRDGEIRILISCKSLDEGLNVPDASIGIILSGTSAQRQRIQRLGRIIRKKEKKSSASLYYLHIMESVEDHYYLPDSGASRILELEYSADTQEFKNSSYETAARELLSDMQRKGADADQLAEILRCLDMGIVRSNWLSDIDGIEENIRKAKNVSDKNYWICMKKMAQSVPENYRFLQRK